jgi:ABC-type uncharacterized transport system permease subunit
VKKLQKSTNSLISIVGVFLATMIFGALIILMIGKDPLLAYSAMFSYALGDVSAIANLMNRSMALILSALCAAVASNAGIYNLGGKGQIELGAIAAAVVGYKLVGLPLYIHLPLCILAAVVMGILGAAIPGYMRVKWKVDEVISTIMLNSVFFMFTSYLANYPFRDVTRWSGTTPPILDSATLPYLVKSIDLRSGIIFALVAAAIIYWILNYTNQGYRWKMIGLNPRFAQYGGVNVGKDQMKAMVLSGFLSGLAGAVLVCGSNYRFWEAIAGPYGWDGVLIAMLAKNNPIAIVAVSFVFSIFKNGALGMEQVASVPSDLTGVLLAALILFITGREFVSILFRRRKHVILVDEEVKQ